MPRIFPFIFFLLAWAGASAQNALPVIFNQDTSRNTTIGALKRGGTLYGSLANLAHVFNLETFYNPETQKFELTANQFTIKLTPGNSFIIVIDQKRNANIIQLQRGILFAANEIYVPLDEFIPVLDDIMRDEIVFDRAREAISIGRITRVSGFDISGVSIEEKTNGDLIRLQCTKKLANGETWLKAIGDDTWVYVTLADARADAGAIEGFKSNGILKKVFVFQSPTSVQLTFKLKGQITSAELMPADGSNDMLIAIHRPTEEELSTRRVRDYEGNLQRERDRWKLDVVVIDPGHGGDDPGTIGVTKTREKDVTLAIGLKVGKLIEKNLRDVNVVYTRKRDEFIELYRRGQIANQAGGKLFISIHCNSLPRKSHSADGFEIYLLRPGKTENALRIAERENAVVKFEQGYEQRYQQFTEENFILLTMAQSAYVKYSEKFADILQQEMGRHTDIDNNGVKQAGFYVLVGASMPNVLVETAYLSNRHDEKILKSVGGQERIAEAIFNSIKRYKHEYEKSLQEGKEMGAFSR